MGNRTTAAAANAAATVSPAGSKPRKNPNATTTITEGKLQEYRDKISTYSNNNKKLVKEKNQLIKANDEKDKIIKELQEKETMLVQAVHDVGAERDDWKKRFDEVIMELSKEGKTTKYKQNKEIGEKTRKYVMDKVFRKTKFAVSDEKVNKIAGVVYDALEKKYNFMAMRPTPLTKKDYARIYGPVIRVGLGLKRQYTASRAQEAAAGMSNHDVLFAKFCIH